MALATTAAGIPSENIRSDVLDYDYVTNHKTETGAQVLVLINRKSAALIQSLFYD